MDDVILIKETLSGDKESFAILINRYKDKIFNLCYRMMNNYHDAEDISQETFLQVYKKLNGFKLGQKFQNWLFTIAINLCRNKLKRDRIIKFISIDKTIDTEEDKLPFQIKDKSPSPEECFILEEEKKKIYRLVRSLPVKYRPVFLLRYLEGLPYQEIVEITGLPIGTVETYLFRAKKLILKNIEIISSGRLYIKVEGDKNVL